MKKWLKGVWRRFVAEAMRPMTQHEYDSMMAMAGAKRCPHCRRWLSRGDF